jgi:hypothetical protein
MILEGSGLVIKEALWWNLSDGLREATRNNIADVASEIRAEPLPNMGLQCYRHGNPLGNLIIETIYFNVIKFVLYFVYKTKNWWESQKDRDH